MCVCETHTHLSLSLSARLCHPWTLSQTQVLSLSFATLEPLCHTPWHQKARFCLRKKLEKIFVNSHEKSSLQVDKEEKKRKKERKREKCCLLSFSQFPPLPPPLLTVSKATNRHSKKNLLCLSDTALTPRGVGEGKECEWNTHTPLPPQASPCNEISATDASPPSSVLLCVKKDMLLPATGRRKL